MKYPFYYVFRIPVPDDVQYGQLQQGQKCLDSVPRTTGSTWPPELLQCKQTQDKNQVGVDAISV